MSFFHKCTLFFFGKKIEKVPTCGGKFPLVGGRGPNNILETYKILVAY
jgi:hypothetical protein